MSLTWIKRLRKAADPSGGLTSIIIVRQAAMDTRSLPGLCHGQENIDEIDPAGGIPIVPPAVLPDKSRVRGWLFTWNNYTDQVIEHLRSQALLVTYIIWGKEVSPTTGTPHLQGFVYYSSKKSFQQVQKVFNKCWIGPVSVDNGCAKYSTKDGDYEEHGTRPLTRRERTTEGGEATKRKYDDAFADAAAGNFDAIPSDLKWKHYNTMKNIFKDNQPNPADLLKHDNYWLYGMKNTGKSFKARQMAREFGNNVFYIKAADDDWWDGYQGEDTVIIDDFDKYHVKMGYHLKIWADKYYFSAPIKGTKIKLRPKRIIVTSNYRIEDIWDDFNTIEPLKKRFPHFVHMTDIYDDDGNIVGNTEDVGNLKEYKP